MLFETAQRLQQTDFNDATELEILLPQVKQVIGLFDTHAHTEDTLIFATLTAYEPALIDAFEKEHEQDILLGIRICNIIEQLEKCETGAEKTLSGAALNVAFQEFVVFNLAHMAHEETVMNPILWRYFSDDELKKVTDQIKKSTPHMVMMEYCKWMLRGLSLPEIKRWLKEVKQEAPPPVFNNLLQVAEDILPPVKWQELNNVFASNAADLKC